MDNSNHAIGALRSASGCIGGLARTTTVPCFSQSLDARPSQTKSTSTAGSRMATVPLAPSASRFRIVPVESSYKRGRWKCHDYFFHPLSQTGGRRKASIDIPAAVVLATPSPTASSTAAASSPPPVGSGVLSACQLVTSADQQQALEARAVVTLPKEGAETIPLAVQARMLASLQQPLVAVAVGSGSESGSLLPPLAVNHVRFSIAEERTTTTTASHSEDDLDHELVEQDRALQRSQPSPHKNEHQQQLHLHVQPLMAALQQASSSSAASPAAVSSGSGGSTAPPFSSSAAAASSHQAAGAGRMTRTTELLHCGLGRSLGTDLRAPPHLLLANHHHSASHHHLSSAASSCSSLSAAAHQHHLYHHLPANSNSQPLIAIDSKIEQAMELVKTHLMYAVREEVDVLRGKIADLETTLVQLEDENAILRKHVPGDLLGKLQM